MRLPLPAGRGVPGVGIRVGGLGGLYRVLPAYPGPALPVPIFNIFKVKGPTYGQMKPILEVS